MLWFLLLFLIFVALFGGFAFNSWFFLVLLLVLVLLFVGGGPGYW